MKIKSLAYRTDLIYSEFEGTVKNKENYLVIKTPSRPSYFWGNYILMKNAPQNESYKEWIDIYKSEFNKSEPNFMTFGIDSTDNHINNLEQFINNGFTIKSTSVLTSTILKYPKKYNSNIEIRQLNDDNDWKGWVDVHKNENWYLSKDSESAFLETQLVSTRKFTESYPGMRFGAFLNGKLVGDLGIYFSNDIGRFNSVSTHQDYRNKGICQTLLYESFKHVTEKCNIKKLVIVADNEYFALDIYKKAGFIETENQIGLEWYNKDIY